MKNIDLNCDMGEGSAFDEDIMPLISSCNIACGGHAGDRNSMANTINAAIQYEVTIGAHPSYPDQENFGRVSMDLSATALRLTLLDQLKLLMEEIERQQAVLYHIKPHGALYNDLKTDREKADIVLDVLEEMDPLLTLVAPPESVIKERAEERGINVKVEGFGDRGYNSDFSLQSRSLPQAVLTDKEVVLKQVRDMVLKEQIDLGNGRVLHHHFDTICIHSDTENSLDILRYLNKQLPLQNVRIGV